MFLNSASQTFKIHRIIGKKYLTLINLSLYVLIYNLQRKIIVIYIKKTFLIYKKNLLSTYFNSKTSLHMCFYFRIS